MTNINKYKHLFWKLGKLNCYAIYSRNNSSHYIRLMKIMPTYKNPFSVMIQQGFDFQIPKPYKTGAH